MKRAAAWSGASLMITMIGLAAIRRTEGALFWGVLGCTLLGVLWLQHWARAAFRCFTGRPWRPGSFILNATLVVVSTTAVLAASEGALAYLEHRSRPARRSGRTPIASGAAAAMGPRAAALMKSLDDFGVRVPADVVARALERRTFMTMPPEWERRDIEVEGSEHAYRWHGVLHVHDINQMRRTTPFPPRRDGVFRALVVGDSLTYGYGIDEADTYAARLQQLMQGEYRVEFLNLGVSGYQSEDVLRTVRRFVPLLHPDLVIYGVCHNDFLPSGVGQREAGRLYAFPLPDRVKNALVARSRIARLTSDAYDTALLKLGLRMDFYDQILENFQGYQTRFEQDVKEMNDDVTGAALPPVVALVLDQTPLVGSRGHQISQIAEKALAAAGMSVVDTADYYDRFSGQRFGVSRWEGHPNEIAHAIWATMLYDHLRDHLDLARYRRSGAS